MNAQDSLEAADRSSAESGGESVEELISEMVSFGAFISYDRIQLPLPPKPKYLSLNRNRELLHPPTALALSQFTKDHAFALRLEDSDPEDEEEENWRPSASLAKEFKKICVYSDSRVVLTSAAKIKFGRVLFKRRLCRRRQFLVQGDILNFLKKNSRCCRASRVLT